MALLPPPFPTQQPIIIPTLNVSLPSLQSFSILCLFSAWLPEPKPTGIVSGEVLPRLCIFRKAQIYANSNEILRCKDATGTRRKRALHQLHRPEPTRDLRKAKAHHGEAHRVHNNLQLQLTLAQPTGESIPMISSLLCASDALFSLLHSVLSLAL
jgi:hypothetical protein